MMHYSSINQVVRKERLELSRTRTSASKAGVSAFHHFRILALRSANRTFSAYFAFGAECQNRTDSSRNGNSGPPSAPITPIQHIEV